MDEIKIKLGDLKIGDLLMWKKNQHSWTTESEELYGIIVNINSHFVNKKGKATLVKVWFSRKVQNRTNKSDFLVYEKEKEDYFIGIGLR